MSSPAPIAGRATFTIVMSRTTMNWATARTARTDHGRRSAVAGRGGWVVVALMRVLRLTVVSTHPSACFTRLSTQRAHWLRGVPMSGARTGGAAPSMDHDLVD